MTYRKGMKLLSRGLALSVQQEIKAEFHATPLHGG